MGLKRPTVAGEPDAAQRERGIVGRPDSAAAIVGVGRPAAEVVLEQCTLGHLQQPVVGESRAVASLQRIGGRPTEGAVVDDAGADLALGAATGGRDRGAGCKGPVASQVATAPADQARRQAGAAGQAGPVAVMRPGGEMQVVGLEIAGEGRPSGQTDLPGAGKAGTGIEYVGAAVEDDVTDLGIDQAAVILEAPAADVGGDAGRLAESAGVEEGRLDTEVVC